MSEFKRSFAVLIGVNNYINNIPKLKTAVNDATCLASILKDKYSYNNVLLLLEQDAIAAKLNSLIAEFQQKTLPLADGSKIQLDKDDRLLFYFAGHGIAQNADEGVERPEGFLVPQDARFDVDDSLISMRRLHDALTELPCRHLLVILDCCFAGTFRWAGLHRQALPKRKIYRESYHRFINGCAQQVITSAAHDETAADSLHRLGQRCSVNGHSPFAELLLKALSGAGDLTNDGVITATEIYLYIHTQLGYTSAKQTPGFCQLKKHDKGEYIFPVPGFTPKKLPQAIALTEKTNPYQGLLAFEEEDREFFFGREKVIKDLALVVEKQPLTVVLGTSGSGKSSLVKAGLIPYLRQQGTWLILPPMRPEKSPFVELHNTLQLQNITGFFQPKSPSAQDIDKLFTKIANWIQHNPQSKLLLAIDQFEELITLCEDDERHNFLDLLYSTIDKYHKHLRIILTLRTDFEPQFSDTVIKPYWQPPARFIIPAMTRAELKQAIEEPASKRVIFFESGHLMDKLIDEVVQMPGALPLLSFTLSSLYLMYLESERKGERNNRTITEEDYNKLGGVSRSLTQTADSVYEDLVERNLAYSDIIKNVMLRMVAVDSGELARRQVFVASELKYPKSVQLLVDNVIKHFIDARLIISGQNAKEEPYIEPAHDALVRGWQKLRDWVKEEEQNIILQRRLTHAAIDWQKNQKLRKFLWNSDPYLDVLSKRLKSNPSWFNSVERKFVIHSLSRRDCNIILRYLLVAIALLTMWVLKQDTEIQALASSSDALFADNRQLDALIEGIKAEKARSRAIWVSEETKIKVMNALVRAVYWIIQRDRFSTDNSQVRSVRFSPDGTILAGATDDKSIRLWRLDDQKFKNGKTFRIFADRKGLKGHEGRVNSISFSQDGKLMASGGWDSKVILWDVREEKYIRTLAKHKAQVYSVSFSPDNRTLASGSWDGTIKICDAASGKLMSEFPSINADINVVNFSPDGKMLVSTSNDKIVRFWSLDGKVLKTLKGHKDNVIAASFSQNGTLLATASFDKNVNIWNVADGKLIDTLKGHQNKVYSVSFSPERKMLASAGSDNVIKLWDLSDLNDIREIGQIAGHSRRIESVRFSPDGKTLASGSNDKTIRLWNLILPANLNPASKSIQQNNEEKLGKEKSSLLPVSSSPIAQLTGHTDSINSLKFSRDGKNLLTASADGKTILWDLNNSSMEVIQNNSKVKVNKITLSPDGKILASANSDRSIKLWSVPSGQLINTLKGHKKEIYSVNFNQDGKILVSADANQNIKLWRLDNYQEFQLPNPIKGYTAEFVLNGQAIATTIENLIVVWDATSGKKIWELVGHKEGSSVYAIDVSRAPILTLAFTQDSKFLASGGDDKTLFLWNLELLNRDKLLHRGCSYLRDYLVREASNLCD